MVNIFDDSDTSGCKLVDPWVGQKPDCRVHSAADWYNIILKASFGGKQVHGFNASPTCEVLRKVPNDYAGSETGVGYIKWDPTTLSRPSIGTDLSGQFYTHQAFKGTVTASENVLAYENGLWEPNVRTRAKSTSLLDAVKTVGIIASDEIDEEAVSSPILPASNLKREMTTISKANHRIFTKGTLQSGIIWDDANLSLGIHAPSMDFDSGRVTAIARYIAEANVQICPTFRRRASSSKGIPYFVVRNSGAYVTPTDYQLRPSIFSSVPKVNILKYGIPSTKGAFPDHEDEEVIPGSHGYDDSMLVEAEDLEFLKAGFREIIEERVTPIDDPYVLAINSYPNADIAEEYARVSGYANFRDAFNTLGDEVMYLENRDHIIDASTSLAFEKTPKITRKKGYETVI